ncbi:MAG: AsmA family protein [Gammaproteobacteria bacterium]|nr:MAG: AsmA family protein [Gammaproteobacteria bacterium]
MKLFFKISLTLIVLLFIAVIGFALIFNPNDYKEDIIKIVKDKTGRELSIPGDISLSLFPWIGIDLGTIEISNAKGFGKQPFAKMSHLQVRAKLWPLFKQQLEADTIVIDGLKLNLTKNKKGKNNWDDLTKNKSRAKPEATTKPSSKTGNEKDNTKNILAAVALNGIKIQNAQFNWHDQQQKQKISIKDVQLSLGKLRPETKIPFNIQFHLQEKSLDASIKLKSSIVFSSDLNQFSFYNTELSSDLKLASLKNSLAPQLSSSLMRLDIKKQTFNTQALNLSESTLKLQTKIAVKKLLSKPYINSQIIITPFNPRTLAKKFSITLPETSDKNALTRLSAQLNIKGSFDKIGLTNIELSLDDTNIVGNAKYRPMPGSSALNLVVDNINLDRYLPKPVTANKKSKNTKNKSKVAEAAILPVALLSLVNLDTNFKIKKLQIKNTHWKNLHAVTRSKNGQIQIKPLTMQGYGSRIQSDFKIKVLKNNALLSGNLNIKNIKAGKLLNDLMAKDKLKGQTSIAANFNTSGIKLSQLKRNLNGNLKLRLQDGTLKGFDLNHEQKVLEAKIKRQPIPAAPKPVETKIANLRATAVIKKGVLTNKDLRAATPLSRIAGQGTVNIPKEQLNYTASVKFTSSKDIKANKPYEKMDAVPLNIYIRGTFNKPDVKVDFAGALKQLLKKELKKKKRELKKKITEKKKKELKEKKKELKNKLENKLKKLFKF